MRSTRTKTAERIDLPSLIETGAERSADAFGELLLERQERLWEGRKDERLSSGCRRFVKNGGYRRTFVSRLGAVRIRVQRVTDRWDGTTTAPLLEALGIGKRRYTPDLRVAAAEEATRTSYLEAEAAIRRFTGLSVPRQTVWGFVKELAARVEGYHRSLLPHPFGGVVQPDTVFVRSRERSAHHGVHVAIVQDPEEHHCEVLNVEVDGPPRRVLEGIDVERMASDGDPSLFSIPTRWHQLCDLHFRRMFERALVDERGRQVPSEERERWVRPLVGALRHLEASVQLHKPRGEWAAIAYRTRETVATFQVLAKQLREVGQVGAAQLLENEGKSVVVFGELAARGIWMPATSNGVERIAGTIAHRCKRAWAHWGSGLRSLVVLLLIRKTRPEIYRSAIARYMRPVSRGVL